MFLLLDGVAVIAILYFLFDVDYFLKFGFIIVWGRLFDRKKKKILDPITIYGICTTHDVDILLKHMNNARYLRDLDFGRYYYYDRTNFYTAVIKRRAAIVQTACIIRYRQAIPTFMPYKIVTKLIYWEDKHFYMKQQFVRLTDNFVYATILNRQTLIGTKILAQDIIADIEPKISRPMPTKEFILWLKTTKESSQYLRKQT